MPDDGFSEVGGGGSINWQLDVDDGETVAQTPKPGKPKGYSVKSTDRKGRVDVGRFFLVRIEDWNTVLMTHDGNDLVLAVPVKKKDGHIRVRWTYDRGEIEGMHPNLKPMV